MECLKPIRGSNLKLMLNSKFISTFDSLNVQSTSHNVGEKYIYFKQEELQSPLIQIAIGILKAKDIIPLHIHESMEEVFYVLSGNGIFYIGEEHFNVSKHDCIRVPSGHSHSIIANTDLHFYYFGVATI